MSKAKKVELQITVQSQDQWEELLQKEGLIVVDAYAAWCGPCKAVVSTLKRVKNEIGDDLLHFALAETDNIDSLSLYRGKSQPTFLFYASGILVHVVRGCNCPVIIKTIKNQLEREHKVLEGKTDRIEYIDKEVGVELSEEKKDEQKEFDEEEEEIAAKMTASMLSMRKKVSFRDLNGFVEIEVAKEVSLAIIKPDAVKAGLVDDIIAKVEAEGMEILRKEERTLTKEEAAEFYKQHEGSEHFEELVEFMSSGPCLTLIISKGETGDGVIPQFRDLIGPKDVNVAKEEAPTSIRALYGTSSVMNAIHACDTSESAARELAFFFPDFVSPAVKTKKPLNKRSSSRTLALIRPDALRHHKDSILEKIKEAGFSIAMAKELTLTREEAEDFYAEHKNKDFFEPLVHNMCSGPIMALCLVREDAVESWRNMLGPKEVDVAVQEAPESLRAQFKVEDCDINPLHGSDSRTAAQNEIDKIFPVQTTVAVIKPETAEESGDAIIDKIKESGFRIISRKDVGLTKELASQFYHEHTGKDFFNGLTDYMSSGQSTVLLLEREDAVSGWRAMMGPTDPEEAREIAPDSIRAVFGKDIVRNAVHGASNVDKAGKVIEELFPDVELLPNGKTKVRSSLEDVSQDPDDQKKLSEEETGGDGGRDSQISTEDGPGGDSKEAQDGSTENSGVEGGETGDVPAHDGNEEEVDKNKDSTNDGKNTDSSGDTESKGEAKPTGDNGDVNESQSAAVAGDDKTNAAPNDNIGESTTTAATTGDGNSGDGTSAADGALPASDGNAGGDTNDPAGNINETTGNINETTGNINETTDNTNETTGDGTTSDSTAAKGTAADGTTADGTTADGATADGTIGGDTNNADSTPANGVNDNSNAVGIEAVTSSDVSKDGTSDKNTSQKVDVGAAGDTAEDVKTESDATTKADSGDPYKETTNGETNGGTG